MIRRIRQSRVLAKAAGFAGANVGVTLLGVVSTTLLARHLAARSYGDYAFAFSLLTFVAMLFEFGLFQPAARLTATSDRAGGREIVGAILLAYIPVGIGFSIAVFALSFRVDGWFHVEAGGALRVIAPLTLAFPFGFLALQLTQGLDRLHAYSLALTGSRVAFLVGVIGLAVTRRLGVTSTLAVESLTMLAAWVGLIVSLRPSCRGAAERLRRLLRAARSYGAQMYIGRVLSMGTYNMDVMMVAAMAGAKQVAFYTLAGSITYPIMLPASAMAAALFPRMTRQREMGPGWLAWSWAVGLGAAVLAVFLARPFISIVLTSKYLSAAPLVLPLALAQAVRGVTGIYHSMLVAHARGSELRNAALVLTGSNLVFNLALIPPFGASGAAWASLFALLANLAAHVVYYRRALLQPLDVPTG